MRNRSLLRHVGPPSVADARHRSVPRVHRLIHRSVRDRWVREPSGSDRHEDQTSGRPCMAAAARRTVARAVKRNLRSDREGWPAPTAPECTAPRLRSVRRADHAAGRTHGLGLNRRRARRVEQARIPAHLSFYTAGRELDCAEEPGGIVRRRSRADGARPCARQIGERHRSGVRNADFGRDQSSADVPVYWLSEVHCT